MRSRLRSSEALCCKVVPIRGEATHAPVIKTSWLRPCVKTFSGIMVVIWMRSRLGTIDVPVGCRVSGDDMQFDEGGGDFPTRDLLSSW
ncbi:unnamed protein product [Brassica rapa]|uniref:Uncharacterized protein n=1 Tax=Brassica campestris TaxID=3711 RepID=A0A8D9H6L4_BRACM|nr:unnamed protein product [Brassica rapa]